MTRLYSCLKDALDVDISDELIPFSGLKCRMNQYIMDLWQHEWKTFPDNKSRQVRPELTDYLPSCRTKRREEETVQAHPHVGHSYLAHSFLLKGEEGPVCISCNEPLTLKHILWQFMGLGEMRKKFFETNSMRALFKNTCVEGIFSFLREIKVFHKL